MPAPTHRSEHAIRGQACFRYLLPLPEPPRALLRALFAMNIVVPLIAAAIARWPRCARSDGTGHRLGHAPPGHRVGDCTPQLSRRKLVPAAILLFVLVAAIVTTLYGKLRARRHRENDAERIGEAARTLERLHLNVDGIRTFAFS